LQQKIEEKDLENNQSTAANSIKSELTRRVAYMNGVKDGRAALEQLETHLKEGSEVDKLMKQVIELRLEN
jgi:hypothetical protein